MKNIYNWLRADGVAHIAVSALLMVALGWVRPLALAILFVAVVGVMKEIYDFISGTGAAEWHDLICDAIGIAIGLVLIFLCRL